MDCISVAECIFWNLIFLYLIALLETSWDFSKHPDSSLLKLHSIFPHQTWQAASSCTSFCTKDRQFSPCFYFYITNNSCLGLFVCNECFLTCVLACFLAVCVQCFLACILEHQRKAWSDIGVFIWVFIQALINKHYGYLHTNSSWSQDGQMPSISSLCCVGTGELESAGK